MALLAYNEVWWLYFPKCPKFDCHVHLVILPFHMIFYDSVSLVSHYQPVYKITIWVSGCNRVGIHPLTFRPVCGGKKLSGKISKVLTYLCVALVNEVFLMDAYGVYRGGHLTAGVDVARVSNIRIEANILSASQVVAIAVRSTLWSSLDDALRGVGIQNE